MSARISHAAIVAILVVAPGVGRAQVMEIGDGGEVTVYDRPAVFEAGAVTPVLPGRSSVAQVPGSQEIRRALVQAADAARLSPELVEAVAWRESHWRSNAVSRAGAVGTMQLMPATARALGVDPYDPVQNVRGGVDYLSGLLKRYDGDLVRALAAYNAGPGAVDRWRGMPPYRETREYVAAILARLSQTATSFVDVHSER